MKNGKNSRSPFAAGCTGGIDGVGWTSHTNCNMHTYGGGEEVIPWGVHIGDLHT